MTRSLIKDEAQFIQSLKIFNNTSIVGAQGAQGGSQSNSPPLAGNFLRKEGDFMIGGFGLHPILVTIDTGVIDARIAAVVGGAFQNNFSSRLIVNGEGAVDDDVDQILSEKIPGMLMVIQGIVGQVLTIKHLAKGGGDEDIRTPDGLDFFVTGEQNVTLIYDAVNNEWAFMDGAISVAGANRTLSNLLNPTSIPVALLPSITATFDVGSALLAWDAMNAGRVNFRTDLADPTGASPHLIQSGSQGIVQNVELVTDAYRFFFNGVNRGSIRESTSLGLIDFDIVEANTQIVMQPSAGDPAIDGIMKSVSGNVKVHSGGEVKNFSNMPEVDETETITGLWTFTNVIHNINSANIFLGDSTSDDLSILAQIDTDFIPNSDGISEDLGKATLNWNDLFIDAIIVRDRIRSDSGTSEMGHFVKNETGSIGTLGTMQAGVLEQAATPTDATLNGFFGAFDGAFGFWRDTDNDANSRGFARMNGVWYYWFLVNLP